MDTPDKTQITPASSLSKFEDSPVFKYINSLSPIELAKSRLTDTVFNSLAFLSPSSLFPSPQVGCHRESRFSVKRHHFLAASNSRALQSSNESNTSEASTSVEQSVLHDEQLGCRDNCHSSKAISSDLLDEQSNLVIELPRNLKFDCGSPDGNLEPSKEIQKNTSLEVVGQEGSPFQNDKDEWEKRQQSFENEKDLRKIRRIMRIEESAGCDWVAMVSDVADMLTMSSSIIYEKTEGQDQGTADSGTTSFISTVVQIPPDNSENLENAETAGPHDSCKQSELEELGADQTPAILSTCLQDKLVVSGSGLKKDEEGDKCIQSSHQQRSIRRRCLVFEKSPGFGLHLNSLGNTSKVQNPLSKLSPNSMKRGEISHNNKAVVRENSPETPVVDCNEADHNSPEKKRQKFQQVEESGTCKRCNCKRSKCLKLYCDCFAAGLYCIEPCSCQDCFNKPIHENIVLETRRQIESRNPLAFAPKVIRSTDIVSESGGETNKTPASARHKRGCNCKKSSCLKKYCECFQAGVGCSHSCRCEGCRNKFGRKDGGGESESDGEDLDTREKNSSEKHSSNTAINKFKEEYSDLSVSSSDISRLPFPYSGRLAGSIFHPVRLSPQSCTNQDSGPSDSSSCRLKYESHLQAIPEDETPDVLKQSCLSPVPVVKPTSPNCKRVSPPRVECSSSATWQSRKLIIRSVPPFPSLLPP